MISTHAPNGALIVVLLVCLVIEGPLGVVGMVAGFFARRAYADSELAIVGDGFPGEGFFPARARGERFSRISDWCGVVCAVLTVVVFVTIVVIVWQSVDVHPLGTMTGSR
ncbi:hypothetical protein AB0C34_17635 [Nocardia sp. NPDC049220]|uniref:hypothetical protein n=1 Tax=Nocardia sp. NPDC049220 TaxID=3155273 RepID=UPI0033D05BA3